METKFEILIVDDDKDLASNLSDILSSEGYGTSVACDGKTAVALCRKKTFDLAIVDMKLPDISGLELIRELVKLSPVMECIIVTGYASLESAIEAVKQESIIAYETKPVEMDRLIALIKQVSRRKQAEEEQVRLRQLAQQASRLASVGEMASGIAHEINNPLTSVIGYSQLLLERDIPEDIREDVGIIADGAQRVADIVKRLLTFSRQYEPVKSSNDINQIIEVVLELRGYELKTGNIEVITRLDPELPWVICDAGQLQQVFMNIITNAETEMRKAHDRGKLIIKTERVGDSIRISFTDDGPGITKENMSRIFDPFFTTREVGEGTGLGLSVSHGIITEHGGQIYAESELGKGTTFFVELPIITEQELPQAIEEAGEEGVKEALPARILVVDDEPSILTYIDKLLTAQGHQVETVNNPVYGLKKIKENRYRLILLDVKMPGMSGIELYNSIREIAPSLTGRVVFITGDMMSADTRKFLTESGVPYITKPFDTKKLKKELNRILSENS